MNKNSVVNISENSISIIGDNILQNNDVLRAYYIIPLTNYTVSSSNAILSNVSSLTNLFSSLASQRPGVKFTIEKCQQVIKAEDIYNNLLGTIELYRPDYDMPKEFTSRISDNYIDYCLLAVEIQQDEVADIEAYSLKEAIADVFKTAVNAVTMSGKAFDYEKILSIEKNIYNTLKTKCVRASRELVFYNYVSKLYPNYEISYTKQSKFDDEHFGDILGVCTQTVEDNFGYFVMHNDGVDFFGITPQTTYGCVLQVRTFPKAINSSNFSMNYPNTQVNIECLVKEKAELMIGRSKKDDEYEMTTAIQAGANDEAVARAAKGINIATKALEALDDGIMLCNFNTNILLLDTTLEGLKSKVSQAMAELRDRDIIVGKSLSQAKTWLDEYVRLCPSKYEQMADLQFPLSFQLNSGATVGDYDAFATVDGEQKRLSVPAIGRGL